MIRPVDVIIDYLQAVQCRGETHVLLDDEARDGLRELFERARSGIKPAALTTAPENLIISGGSRAEQIDALRKRAEHWPTAKQLGTLREKMVFSTGNPDARIMFVGEAPGYEEEKQGEPFVGPAGQKFDRILKAMGITRREVYITNLVKFRPALPKQATNNRKPDEAEMASCLPLLRAEIAIVKPECIVTLGGTASEGLLGLSGAVTAMREKWHAFEGIPARVTYHPSYLLRSESNNTVKRQLWEDMLEVMHLLDMPISDKQRGYFLK